MCGPNEETGKLKGRHKIRENPGEENEERCNVKRHPWEGENEAKERNVYSSSGRIRYVKCLLGGQKGLEGGDAKLQHVP